MKNIFLALMCLVSFPLFAQTDSDTTIYTVVERLPLPMINGCQSAGRADWTMDSIRKCAESQFMTLLAQNVRYPTEARNGNIQGKVVIQFNVEKDGSMSNYAVAKDIGAGCGQEAVRVLKALQDAGLRWLPAVNEAKAVRYRMTIPVKFRLEEELPYYLSENGDTIYTQFEKDVAYKSGMDSLLKYVINRIEYPKAYLDSCRAGVIEMSIQIKKDGSVSVENQLDFNNLGDDFQFNALRLVTRTSKQWEPAQFGGRSVATVIPLRVLFKSPQSSCAVANDAFDKAMLMANEGALLADEGKHAEAVLKFTEALKMQPTNTEILYYRGNSYLSLGQKEECCKDFDQIKVILGITWFEQIKRMICGW